MDFKQASLRKLPGGRSLWRGFSEPLKYPDAANWGSHLPSLVEWAVVEEGLEGWRSLGNLLDG